MGICPQCDEIDFGVSLVADKDDRVVCSEIAVSTEGSIHAAIVGLDDTLVCSGMAVSTEGPTHAAMSDREESKVCSEIAVSTEGSINAAFGSYAERVIVMADSSGKTPTCNDVVEDSESDEEDLSIDERMFREFMRNGALSSDVNFTVDVDQSCCMIRRERSIGDLRQRRFRKS